jgi:hypothetical protein
MYSCEYNQVFQYSEQKIPNFFEKNKQLKLILSKFQFFHFIMNDVNSDIIKQFYEQGIVNIVREFVSFYIKNLEKCRQELNCIIKHLPISRNCKIQILPKQMGRNMQTLYQILRESHDRNSLPRLFLRSLPHLHEHVL